MDRQQLMKGQSIFCSVLFSFSVWPQALFATCHQIPALRIIHLLLGFSLMCISAAIVRFPHRKEFLFQHFCEQNTETQRSSVGFTYSKLWGRHELQNAPPARPRWDFSGYPRCLCSKLIFPNRCQSCLNTQDIQHLKFRI